MWILRRHQGYRGCSWTPSTFLNPHKPCDLLLEGEEPCLHVHTLQDSPIRSVSFSFDKTVQDLWIGHMLFRLLINQAIISNML